MAKRKSPWKTLLVLSALFGQSLQQFECATLSGGCDNGITHDSVLRSAIARFSVDKLYGGTSEPVTFSTSLSGSILAQISYSCIDGSNPPAMYGSAIQSSLQNILTCPNRCGSVSTSDKCGLGVLITNGADAACFGKARDVVPNGRTVTEKPSSGNFNTIGCWTDGMNARALTGGSSSDPAMTVERCVALAQGFKYAGLEYGVECYWGNNIASTSSSAQGQCDMPCAGDAKQLCGGGNLINIYQDSSFAAPAIENPGVGSFQSIGCRWDSNDARILTEGSATDWTGMSVSSCIARAAGYRYAGVEYYGECFWGNTLGTGATAAPNCDTKCTGNQTEFCGGSGRMNVYEDKSYASPIANPGIGAFQLRGCYTDSPTTRALIVGSSIDAGGMTVEKCLGLAGQSRYAAVENAGECYWGDVLVSDKVADGCTALCAGNKREICGGINRITLYENVDWVDPNPTLEELIAIFNDLATQVANLATKLQAWRDAVVAFHTEPPTKRRKRDLRETITTAYQEFKTEAAIFRRRAGSLTNPGPRLRPLQNYFEMDVRSRDPRSEQVIEETRALLSRSDSMISSMDSPGATTPATEMSVATEISGVMGTAQEAAAVVQGGFAGLTTGATIFGFSLRKLFAMVSIVLLEVLNHPVIIVQPTVATTAPTRPTSTVTSSSTSTTAATSTWVVYPTDATAKGQTDTITELLYTMAIVKTDVYTSDFGGGINFWRAPLTEAQAKEIRENSYVSSVTVDCRIDCFDPTEPDDEAAGPSRRALVGTSAEGDDLKLISMEQGSTAAQYGNRYVFEDSAGEGSTVYVIDTGADLSNEEFRNGARSGTRTRWIIVENDIGPQQFNDSGVLAGIWSKSTGHGTCMLSHVVGHRSGTAKKASTVVVRIPPYYAPEHWLEGLAKTVDQILLRREQNVIVTMSFHFPPSWVQPQWVNRFRYLLRLLDRSGVYLVTGSGNNGTPVVEGYPAAFAKTTIPDLEQVPNLVVVGATYDTGVAWSKTNREPAAGVPSVYAPGAEVNCADARHGGIKKGRGTSDATAKVAGVMAYLLSVPALAPNVASPALMKAYLYSTAYDRYNPALYNFRVVWNGVTVASLPNPIPDFNP